MKPGATMASRDPLVQLARERVDEADHAGLGRGVVGLAQVAGDAAIDATPTIRPLALTSFCFSSSAVISSGAVRFTAIVGSSGPRHVRPASCRG